MIDDARLRSEEFVTLDGRMAAVDAIEAALSTWTRAHEPGQAMAALQAAGVPAGVVQTTAEALDDPHLGPWFCRMTHPDVGTHRYPGFPWSFEGVELRAESPPPRIGEHSAEILTSMLGLPKQEVDRLMRAGVTGAKLKHIPEGTPV